MLDAVTWEIFAGAMLLWVDVLTGVDVVDVDAVFRGTDDGTVMPTGRIPAAVPSTKPA